MQEEKKSIGHIFQKISTSDTEKRHFFKNQIKVYTFQSDLNTYFIKLKKNKIESSRPFI